MCWVLILWAELEISKLVIIGGERLIQRSQSVLCRFRGAFCRNCRDHRPGTDYCLGVDIALNMIGASVDSIRATASSFSRAFIIETMGRDCGYLAMTSALATGAEVCLVPEIEYDLEAIGERLREQRVAGNKYILGIVAEGTGMGDALGMDSRLTVLGHVQRGGSPTVYDRIMAFKFAGAAIDNLRDEQGGKFQGWKLRELIHS